MKTGWKHGHKMVFQRNPFHWPKSNGLSIVDCLVCLVLKRGGEGIVWKCAELYLILNSSYNTHMGLSDAYKLTMLEFKIESHIPFSHFFSNAHCIAIKKFMEHSLFANLRWQLKRINNAIYVTVQSPIKRESIREAEFSSWQDFHPPELYASK